jgi:hypothetical protein
VKRLAGNIGRLGDTTNALFQAGCRGQIKLLPSIVCGPNPKAEACFRQTKTPPRGGVLFTMASQRPPEWYPIPAICIYVGCISSGLADELTATLLRLIEASPGLRARIRLA